MSSTRIYHNVSRVPVLSTMALIAANYELYRIHTRTHPYWTPRLEAAGILAPRHDTPADAKTDAGADAAGSAIRWTNLNGVPIPTLDALMPPFRKG